MAVCNLVNLPKSVDAGSFLMAVRIEVLRSFILLSMAVLSDLPDMAPNTFVSAPNSFVIIDSNALVSNVVVGLPEDVVPPAVILR